MSMTFKSSRPTGTMLRVDSTEVFSEAHLTIVLHSREEDICIDPSDAPALALAILEAAGYSEDDRKVSNPLYATEFASAIIKLADGIEEQERNSEAEADRVALEQEALKLAHAGCEAVGDDSAETLDDMTVKDQKFFLAVARRAREINKEGSNA